MAVFDRIPEADLGTKWTHKGWFCFCPVYLTGIEPGEDLAEVERNGVPRWIHSLAEGVQILSIQVLSFFDPGYEPQWMFKVTGELKPRA